MLMLQQNEVADIKRIQEIVNFFSWYPTNSDLLGVEFFADNAHDWKAGRELKWLADFE